MKLFVLIPVLMLLIACAEKPIREGYATTYEYTDDASPGITYEASTRPGISLSDLNDPKKMKAYMDANMKPALPFYIKVYKDYVLATDTRTNAMQKIYSGHLVKIEWK